MNLNLKPGFIDLWYQDIGDQVRWDERERLTGLTDDEIRHADGFRNQEVRDRFIRTRSLLRGALASYMQTSPRDVTILRGRYGKPYLPGNPLFFNVSHSGDKLVLAVTDIADVGVDIEECRERRSLAGLAKRCFAVEEQAYWRDLPTAEKLETFYRFWTAKEAFVKATGRGIGLGLECCVIDPRYFDRFLRLPDDYTQGDEWRLFPLEAARGYSGAVVMKCDGRSFRWRRRNFGEAIH